MISGVLAAALLATTSAAASRKPPTAAVTETRPYDTAEQAAVAALRVAMARSDQFENGGAVVERNGKFFYTDPVSNGEPGHIVFEVEAGPDDRLAAIYHTHPGDDEESHLFSPGDVREAFDLQLTSYIGVLDDGTIRRFVPGKTAMRSYAPPGTMISSGRVSDGVIVARLSDR